jgi:ankyrin repeat protein
MVAAREGHDQTVDLLIHKGADVNVKDEFGQTALIWAEREEQTEVVDIIRKLEEVD